MRPHDPPRNPSRPSGSMAERRELRRPVAFAVARRRRMSRIAATGAAILRQPSASRPRTCIAFRARRLRACVRRAARLDAAICADRSGSCTSVEQLHGHAGFTELRTEPAGSPDFHRHPGRRTMATTTGRRPAVGRSANFRAQPYRQSRSSPRATDTHVTTTCGVRKSPAGIGKSPVAVNDVILRHATPRLPGSRLPRTVRSDPRT